jgi:hypothetical protein
MGRACNTNGKEEECKYDAGKDRKETTRKTKTQMSEQY